MPLSFRLFYDDRVNDVTDTVDEVAAVAVSGPVYFEPALLPGQRIPDPDFPSRPTGLAMRTFTGFLDTDGRLKSEAGGELGVSLWANDPAWGLARLQYRVRAELTDLYGKPVRWHSFSFDAPATTADRNLVQYMPLPGQKFGRGPGAYNITGGSFDEDGNLVLVNSDGSALQPIAPVDDGTLIFVDNSDGTVSVL